MSVARPLDACVSELQNAVDSIRKASDRLRLSSASLSRTTKLVKLRKKQDLVTPDELHRARQSLVGSLEPRFDELLERAERFLIGMENEAKAAAVKGQATKTSQMKFKERGGKPARKIVAAKSKELDRVRNLTKELTISLASARADEQRLKDRISRSRVEAEERSQQRVSRKEQIRLDRAAAIEQLQRRKVELQEQVNRTIKTCEAKRREAAAVQSDAKIRQVQAEELRDEALRAELSLAELLIAYQCQLRFFMSPRFQERGSSPHLKSILRRYVDDLRIRVAKYQDSLFAEAKLEPSVRTRRLDATLRVLFPIGIAGTTMTNVLDTLLSANSVQVGLTDFEKVFPPEQERRHCFSACLRTLESLRVLERPGGTDIIRLRPT